ncbi:MAG: sugar phosphate isomerase/epimerase family protein [Armatimonadota bacterium]
MEKIPVALQLYSVREEMAKDVPGTLEAVADMGYEGVEFAGFFDYEVGELADLCDELGLGIAGAHVQIAAIEGNAVRATIDQHLELGNDFVVVPGLPESYRNSVDAWKRTAEIFNAAIDAFNEAGLELGYHNHKIEFEPLEGEIPWDVFMSNTDERVFGQLDIGHVYRAGADPVPYIEKYPERYLTVHIKDFGEGDADVLVGEGIADWDTILPLCESVAGTEWYIIEQEVYPVPPLEAVRRCLENLRAMGR